MKKTTIFMVFLSLLICVVSCKPKEYTITLNVDNAVYQTLTVTKDEKVTLPSVSKEGHTFEGWKNGEEVLMEDTISNNC